MKAQKPKALNLKGRKTKVPGRLLIKHTARSNPVMPELPVPEPSPPPYSTIDPGIEGAVRILQGQGVETFESCEGGPGHAYPEPTVAFYGTPEAGWRAVGVCFAYGLPVTTLRRVWDVLDANEPTGPHWEVVFRRRIGC